MAVGNLTITPLLDARGRPFVATYPDGVKVCFAKVALPTAGSYSQTDFCSPFHTATGNFESLYGAKFIRQMLFGSFFATPDLASGKMRGIWFASIQKLLLFEEGNSGAAARDEAQIPNATAFGAGVKIADCRIFY